MTRNLTKIKVRNQIRSKKLWEYQDKSQKASIQTKKHRHIILKMQKIKDNGKHSQRTQKVESFTYKGAKIRITTDFSSGAMQTMEWCKIFSVEGKKKPRILHAAKLS